MSPDRLSTCVALGNKVVTKSVSTVEKRLFHNLLEVSFSGEFVTDFCVSDISNRFLVARCN